jgi:hypothetical protein
MDKSVSMINGHVDGPVNNKHETCKWSTFDKNLGEYKCKLFYMRLKPTKCEHCRNYK